MQRMPWKRLRKLKNCSVKQPDKVIGIRFSTCINQYVMLLFAKSIFINVHSGAVSIKQTVSGNHYGTRIQP